MITQNDFNMFCTLLNKVNNPSKNEFNPTAPNKELEILIEISSKMDLLIEHSSKLWQVLLISIKESINIEEASFYTNISKSELYQRTSRKTIKFSKPAKQVFFEKKVLDELMKSNPVEPQ